MSDSDSQDISRDYDGEFPVASPSSSRTRSIEEGAGDSMKTGRSAQDTTPGGDEAESGRRDQEPIVETVPPFGPGKSPRRVIEALTVEYQSLSPVSRSKHVAALPDPEKFRPAPPSSSSAPSSAAPISSSRPSASEPILTGEVESLPLDNDDVRKHSCLLTHFELEEISSLLSGRVAYNTKRSLGNIVDRNREDWIGIHLDSLKAPLTFPFTPLLLSFLKHYRVLPGQILPNAHRILACFPQICAWHNVPCSIDLFNFIFAVRQVPLRLGAIS